MCGIAGIIELGPETGDLTASLHDMLVSIAYRGPDQRGLAQSGRVAIGMNRLSIVDQEMHQIPYTDSEDTISLVYNGEIYNHLDLRHSLPESIVYKTRSDTETCVYTYLYHKEKIFSEYNGMYALAIHDKSRQKLLLIRDKAGEKPLYYCFHGTKLYFASEIKAILTQVPAQEEPLLSYLAYEFGVGSQTMFAGIFQLEPGEYLELDLKTLKHTLVSYWKYWDKPLIIADDPKKIEQDLTDLVEDSILLRTRNLAHNFACFTGGGVDSALISSIARPDRLYYCHYPLGKAFDELDYARMIAKQIGRELTVVTPQKEDFERTRESLAHHLDTPCTWTSFSLWMLMEKLDPEIKVIMTGEAADEAFAGYHRYHLLHHDEQIHQLEAMKEYGYLIGRYYGTAEERYTRLVNRCDNVYDRGVSDYLQTRIRQFLQAVNGDVVHGMGLHDFYSTMQVLLQMSDRVSMAFSRENRAPYLDHRLIQYAFSLPSKYKIRDGITKWILKKIARKLIPKPIADRIDKRGFSAPINLWYGWDKLGQYNRNLYREMVYADWRKNFFAV